MILEEELHISQILNEDVCSSTVRENINTLRQRIRNGQKQGDCEAGGGPSALGKSHPRDPTPVTMRGGIQGHQPRAQSTHTAQKP